MRPPGSGWAFSYARVVLRCWLWIVAPLVFRVLLVCLGRAALCARGRRPAREIATREPLARSDRSRSPARPRRRPRAPLPGPAVAHGRCSLALPSPTGTAAWPWVVVCGSVVAVNHQFRMQFPSSLFKY